MVENVSEEIDHRSYVSRRHIQQVINWSVERRIGCSQFRYDEHYTRQDGRDNGEKEKKNVKSPLASGRLRKWVAHDIEAGRDGSN